MHDDHNFHILILASKFREQRKQAPIPTYLIRKESSGLVPSCFPATLKQWIIEGVNADVVNREKFTYEGLTSREPLRMALILALFHSGIFVAEGTDLNNAIPLECTCPTTCDCQNPNPENGVALVSNECPIHNENPRPTPDCPVHDPDHEL